MHLLTEFSYSEGKDWRFTLEKLMMLKTGIPLGTHCFLDQDGEKRASLYDDIITIYPSYSWDGASPKVRIFGKWCGTPDYEGTRLASMVHDVCYQFLHLPCFPLKRVECDDLFGQIMKIQKCPMWWIYSRAVMAFGGIHYATGTLLGNKRKGTCAL